jgi:hypothetical protein
MPTELYLTQLIREKSQDNFRMSQGSKLLIDQVLGNSKPLGQITILFM